MQQKFRSESAMHYTDSPLCLRPAQDRSCACFKVPWEERVVIRGLSRIMMLWQLNRRIDFHQLTSTRKALALWALSPIHEYRRSRRSIAARKSLSMLIPLSSYYRLGAFVATSGVPLCVLLRLPHIYSLQFHRLGASSVRGLECAGYKSTTILP